MLKRNFWIRSSNRAGLALSFGLTLTACDSTPSQSNPLLETAGEEQVAESARPHHLAIFCFGETITLYNKQIKAAELYTAEHPNVSFEYIYCSGVDYQTEHANMVFVWHAPDIISTAVDIMVPYLDTGSFE